MNQNNLNPWALALLILSCFVVLVWNRQRAVNAIMLTALFIPMGQMFVVGGLHLRFLPILVLVGLVRIILRGEILRIQLTKLDKLFLSLCCVSLICAVLRGPTANNVADFFVAVGAFLVFRSMITETEDVVAALRLLALVGIGMGSVMLYEHATGRNPFFVLGGVPAFDVVRDGKPRCQGAFRHALMAGAFGASLLPLMIGLWHQGGRDRRRGLLGIIGSVIITVTAVSSGAILTLMAGVVGVALWRFRERMRLFRRSIVAMIILLQLVMKVPVWYIFSKASDVFGGSGWYRSYLIDQFIKHFNEWWLIGTSVTGHWAPAGETVDAAGTMTDVTNHYVAQGILGGLLGLVLFIWMLVSCFKIVGRLVRANGCGILNAKFLWMLGVTMGAHCVAFFSVWYFDQIIIYWLWLLGTISSLDAIHARTEPNVAADEDQALLGPVEKTSLEAHTT